MSKLWRQFCLLAVHVIVSEAYKAAVAATTTTTATATPQMDEMADIVRLTGEPYFC